MLYELKKYTYKLPETQRTLYLIIIIVIIAFSYVNSVTILGSNLSPSLPPRLSNVLE